MNSDAKELSYSLVFHWTGDCKNQQPHFVSISIVNDARKEIKKSVQSSDTKFGAIQGWLDTTLKINLYIYSHFVTHGAS